MDYSTPGCSPALTTDSERLVEAMKETSLSTDSWFEAIPPEILTAKPARAALHSPEPRALGSGAVESLASFLLRTAHSHSVAPSALVKHLQSQHGSPSAKDYRQLYCVSSYVGASGIGAVARALVTATERATGRSGLDRMTLTAFAELQGTQRLMARRRRWCPVCVACDASYEEAHGKLLWTLEAVTACPEHGCVLVENCGCSARTAIPAGQKKLHPGVCPKCCRALNSRSCAPGVAATSESVAKAKLAMELLVLGQQANFNIAHSRARFVQFLHSAAGTLDGGGVRSFARRLGCSPGQLLGWMRGTNVPNVPNLLHFLLTLRSSIHAAFVEGRFTLYGDVESYPPLTREKMRKRRNVVDLDEVQHALENFAVRQPPPTVVAVAKELGMSYEYLREKFPVRCREISGRWLVWRQQAEAKAATLRLARGQDIAYALAARGVRPTKVKVIEAAKLASDYRRKSSKGKILAICRAATVEWRRVRAAEQLRGAAQISEP